jgi:exosortase A-associated hydrolase 1
MNFHEEPFFFECESDRLPGIVAVPDSPQDMGVLIIVGGPQYRIGSHRQFVLLARAMASAGIPSMRFDYRGSGDATGFQRTYEDLDSDIAAAVAAFVARAPFLKTIVLWGLCGAATAALFYAYKDPRITGLILVNPWVRTEQSMARTYLRYYYLRRLLDPQLWRKVMRGDFDFSASARSLACTVKNVAKGWLQRRSSTVALIEKTVIDKSRELPARMAAGLGLFGKDVLIVLSGADYTAKEFRMTIKGNPQWEQALARNRVAWHEIADANHTFATQDWRDEVAQVTLGWIRELASVRLVAAK